MDRSGDRDIFKKLVALSVPVVLEEILSTLLQYVDTAMVGHLGKQATAAVSVTTTISWLTHALPAAVGVAVLSMIAKALGAGQEARIRRVANQSVILVLALGGVLTLLTVGLSPWIPAWMGAEPAIRRQSTVYFAIVSIPMLFRTGTAVFAAAIRATKDTKTPMYINMAANLLNLLLNYFFIYVLGLGVTGAAIGSAISYGLAGIWTFVAFCKNPLLHVARFSLEIDADIMRQCVKTGLPVFGTNGVSCLGYIVFARLVAGMGTTVFSAHSIAVTAETIFYISGYGFRTAASTLVGIAVGEQNQEKYDGTCRVSIALTVAIMCVSGLVLYLVATPLMGLFTNDAAVRDIGAEMLRLVAFSEPFFGLMIVVEGIYYGQGHTRYPFLVESFGMWAVRILAAYICVEGMGLGLREVWYCMIADNVAKALLLFLPMLRKRTRLRV